MDRKETVLSVLGFVMCVLLIRTAGEASAGLAVYEEVGGAPALLQAPKSPGWMLRKHDQSTTGGRCQSAVRQGRRNYSEDRTFCTLDIHVPFPGPNGVIDTSVGILAVFDGHNGAEASEKASELLLEYFSVHATILLDATYSFLSKVSMGMLGNGVEDGLDEKQGEHVLYIGRTEFTWPTIFDGAFRLKILKESLLRAIDAIDAEFVEEASRWGYKSGSTATVILMADSQLLVANIGDSKAFLCSEIFQSPPEAKATLLRLYRKRRVDGDGGLVRMKDFKLGASTDGLPHFSAKVLTEDHHPERADERSRIESAGGHVSEWAGVWRVNGQLAVSRSIGDVSYKRFGVISAPEVTDWQPLTSNDSYLVAISDGIFERLTPQDVCDMLWELQHTHRPLGLVDTSSCSNSSSLADCIVDTAFQRGSGDNLAAVVLPFRLQHALPAEPSRLHHF